MADALLQGLFAVSPTSVRAATASIVPASVL